MSEGTRYFTWRSALARPIWLLDRHWYVMLGQLFLGTNVLPAADWAERSWWLADGRDVPAGPLGGAGGGQ